MAMKAVQISTSPVGENHAIVVALREDGSMWSLILHKGGTVGGEWIRMPSLPQHNGDPDKPA